MLPCFLSKISWDRARYMSKILWFVMLTVMLGYAVLKYLYKSEQNLMPCYALLLMTWIGIICEQNLMIPYEIDHVLLENHSTTKVIYPKYSKQWPYTVAHTIGYVCSKMLNHGLNHGFVSLTFQTYTRVIHIECSKQFKLILLCVWAELAV